MITIDGARYILGLFSNRETPLPAFWVALSGGTLGPTATGVDIVEPETPEYTRVLFQNISHSWNLVGTTMSNANPIVFPVAVEAWGLIRGVVLCSEDTEGRILFAETFDEPVYIEPGQQVSLPPGALVLDFDVDRWSL